MDDTPLGAVDALAPFDALAAGFAPISLAELNARAAMLERIDNKYVIDSADLRAILPQLASGFDVLEIDGRRHFTYDSCYFDDAGHRCYMDHLHGRRQRLKVRLRRYLEAGLCFVEVKLKDKRGMTLKRRLPYPPSDYGRLDARALEHVRTAYESLYRRPFRLTLVPVVEMRYRRMTLVSRDTPERMTIDAGLAFQRDGRTRSVSADVFIIETKSANGNGLADGILRAHHRHPVPGCSKYCTAMAALQAVPRHNRFLPALRRLYLLPGSRLASCTMGN